MMKNMNNIPPMRPKIVLWSLSAGKGYTHSLIKKETV
jgi:hypothetical protein